MAYEPNLHFPHPENEKLYDLRKPKDEYNFHNMQQQYSSIPPIIPRNEIPKTPKLNISKFDGGGSAKKN